MRPFLFLRAVVLMKRLVLAAERIAVAQEKLAAEPKRHRPKVAEVFTVTNEQRNDLYREDVLESDWWRGR